MMNFQTINEMKEYCKQLLKQTDYTQLPDVMIANKEAFKLYRESVRMVFLDPCINAFIPPQPTPEWTQLPP